MAAGNDIMAGSRIAPLTNIQKLFLQRLLASHVMTDDEMNKLFVSMKDRFANVYPSVTSGGGEDGDDDDDDVDHGYLGDDLDHALGIINSSLVPGFEMEIRTVALPPPYVVDDDDDDVVENNNNGNDDGVRGGRRNNNGRGRLVRYHGIVNRVDDASSRDNGYPASRGGPHEMAYYRLVFERIIERGNARGGDDDDDDDGGRGRGGGVVGCTGSLNRMELINLRTELDGDHGDKLTVERTEMALSGMIEEGWIVRAYPPGENGADDDDDDDGGDYGPSSRKRRKDNGRRRRSSSSSSSLKGTYYGIGPRSFMELGDFLVKAGLSEDRMPQSILHRI